ncbi:3-(methylthio)propionyl-CoA ligase [Noviherbaspirillum sedimenti]|uniref:Long-chain-fatty-acid--CoA ligase n=1 Tax=Noviherbaspirillum sedimenti TaxID=2320865 RepID=A0A3A3FX89_9BURK|nr:3-(methylthio)propionyl-CoA ligase [Noviherbaspirillum sedimenti]RJG00823.1 long-chain-fatty-acid--CoA ligase [Noviherbaspirillum sedimenti]
MSLLGDMINTPLLISSLLRQAASHHRHTEIVSRLDSGEHRTTYRDCESRSKRLAKALAKLGMVSGDRIGTLAWNDHRHLELYYGISGSGLVCHTVNPRLFADQVAYIINHGGDRLVFFDAGFLPLVESIAGQCPGVQAWVLLDQPGAPATPFQKNLLHYEALLAEQDDSYAWPSFDENSASMLCYTSGTTGDPKGVLYSHRATVIHAYVFALPDSANLSARDVIMPVVPLFHAKAWESPYAAPLVGAKLVLPGSKLDGASLYELMEKEGVTISVGVPTVWLSLLNHVKDNGLRFSSLKRLLVGGSSTPPAIVAAYAELGVELLQGWGMTETAAITTCTSPLALHKSLSPEEVRHRVNDNQGRIVAGAEMRIVDDENRELPWDGVASGHLQVRGPWIAERYYRHAESALVDGWLPTGDIAHIDADGYMKITDRSKDVVKSGGEWISSIDIENVAAAHPAVQLVACIGAAHPKWDERPLLVILKKPGMVLSRAEILKFFEGKVAKWWVPDDVIFVDEMPMTATGKLYKLKLRDQYKDYLLEPAEAKETK